MRIKCLAYPKYGVRGSTMTPGQPETGRFGPERCISAPCSFSTRLYMFLLLPGLCINCLIPL